MADKNVLSDEEMDALLNGVEEGSVGGGGSAPPLEGEVIPFDFKDQEHLSRNRFPQLEVINQRFVRGYENSLYRLFKQTVEIEAQPVELCKYGEYIDSVEIPSAINVVQIRPLKGSALVVFDSSLVFLAVDTFFGGDGHLKKDPDKTEFTVTERRIVQMLLEMAFTNLAEAWEPVAELGFHYLKSEVNPKFTTILTASEGVVVSRYQIKLLDGGGMMHLVLPLALLEPVREQLESGLVNNGMLDDAQWQARMRQELLKAEVEVSSNLVEVPMTLGEVLRLSPGDLIPVELSERVVVRAAGVPLLQGEFGVVKGKNGIKIEQPLEGMVLQFQAGGEGK